MKKPAARAKTVVAAKGRTVVSKAKPAAKAKTPGKAKVTKETKESWGKPPAELLALFSRTAKEFKAKGGLELREMFGFPTAFVNGNMFFSIHRMSVVARLDERERNMLLASGDAEPFTPMPGMTMREYVCLGDKIVASDRAVALWFSKAMSYARSLPPKEKAAPMKRAPRKAG